MKKNIMTVFILALCIVNLILTSVMVFAVVPASKRTDNLIKQVASVIDLELEGNSGLKIDIDKIETFTIEESKTMNLRKGADGKERFAVMEYVTLSINTTSEDYKTLNPTLDGQKTAIMDIVGDVIASYTYDEAVESRDEIKQQVVEKLQEHFSSADFIVDVSFGNLLFS